MSLDLIRLTAIERASDTHNPLLPHEALFETVIGLLGERGHLSDAVYGKLETVVDRKKAEIHGFHYDEELDIHTIIYLHNMHRESFSMNEWERVSCPKSDLKSALNKLGMGLEAATRQMPIPREADIPQLTRDRWDQICKQIANGRPVHLALLTTGEVTQQARKELIYENNKYSIQLWDLPEIERITQGQEISVEVDFEKYGNVHCVTGGAFGANLGQDDSSVQVYLAALPGSVLADLYLEHRSRILEQNVRSHLASSKINQGIRKTIKDTPERFLAYNNGIAVTASALRLKDASISTGVFTLQAASNFQIVNGGQTTASLCKARLEGADLTHVRVAMKLTVVPPEHIPSVVPQISKCANTQNKVNSSDFESNDIWLVELEKLSRREEATIQNQPTKWFFERAAGQYGVERDRNVTPARKKQFEALHPKQQKFKKTDFCLVTLAWTGRPDLANKGAEKAFTSFLSELRGSNGNSEIQPLPTADNFKQICVLLLLRKEAERLFRELQKKDLRSQSILFAIAALADRTSGHFPFDHVWKTQTIPSDWLEDLRVSVDKAHKYLDGKQGNKTEAAKKLVEWEAFREISRKADFKLSEKNGFQKLTFAELTNHNTLRRNMLVILKLPAEQWRTISELGYLEREQREVSRKLADKRVTTHSTEILSRGAKILIQLAKLKPEIGDGFRNKFFSDEEWTLVNHLGRNPQVDIE